MTSVSRLNKGVQDGWGLPCVFAIKVKSSRMMACDGEMSPGAGEGSGKVAVGCHWGYFPITQKQS